MNEDLLASTMDKKQFLPLPNKGSISLQDPSNNSGNNNGSSNNNNKNPNFKPDHTVSNHNWGGNFRGNNGGGRRRGGEGAVSRSSSISSTSSGVERGQKFYNNNSKKGRGGRGNGGEQVTGGGKRNGPEVGSLQTPGSKKRDWDNLFYFTPRERRASPCVWKSHHMQRGRRDSGGSGGKGKFSKENFLRANCQFLVKEGKDYEPYIADPDLLVDWNDVEQIVVTMIGEGASCPICLGTPVAAKITKCGHIYCIACIFHYLALSDHASRPCPICYESIASKDLKSVVTHVHFDVELGDIVEMELLRRHKDQSFATPLHAHEATDEWKGLYSKVLIMSRAEVIEKVIDREHRELMKSYSEDPDCPEVCFVHQAIEDLQLRKVKLLEKDDGPTETVAQATDCMEQSDASKTGASSHSIDNENSVYFYFYQDSKGLNIFLHPLNFSMLTRQFGTDMHSWPRYLSFRIIDKEYYTTSPESRKRWKFLKHLPLCAPFIVVEVDLGEYVSPEVMEEFAGQIEIRKARREQRAQEEKKLEKLIKERERKLWKIPAVPQFEPKIDFPDFLEVEEYPAAESSGSSTATSDAPSTSDITAEARNSATSFAKIASRAPVPSAIKKSPTFPVEGSSLTLINKSTAATRRHSDSEPDEDYVPAPEFRASISDAITKAMENVLREEKTTDTDASGNKNKKKKNKGKVLFAMGGMGSYN